MQMLTCNRVCVLDVKTVTVWIPGMWGMTNTNFTSSLIATQLCYGSYKYQNFILWISVISRNRVFSSCLYIFGRPSLTKNI